MLASMPISTVDGTSWIGLQVPAVSSQSADRTERILAALGRAAGGLPKVDQDTLARYMRPVGESAAAVYGVLPAAGQRPGEGPVPLHRRADS